MLNWLARCASMRSPSEQPRSNEPVEVVTYDPLWPTLFETDRELILSAIGDVILNIEHVGSTAVHGLAAKPVVDIMVGVRSLELSDGSISAMAAIGYEFMGDGNVAGRLYFRKGAPRSHQVHMTILSSDFWNDHILFRDLLRAHPGTARKYGHLKRTLAKTFRNDRIAYTDAKSEFIQSTLAKVRP